MNRKVYILSLILFFLSFGIIFCRIKLGKNEIAYKDFRHPWRISIVMKLTGEGGRGKARLTLPRTSPHQIIYNEHFETNEMSFYIRDSKKTGNRLGYWKNEIITGGKLAQYNFSAQLKPQNYVLPVNLSLSKDSKSFPEEFHLWLEPSDLIQSKNSGIRKQLKRILKKDKNQITAIRKIFDYVRGEIAYKSEKGSKDAKLTLSQLEADCGGKARLFVAFSRAAGIPSRIVGGFILKPGVKEITHVWAENYIAGQWVPFDVVNNYYAQLPAHYLEVYRGDVALIRHLGLKKFQYYFVIEEETVPPLDSPWSLYALPVHFQSMVKVLLLIPIGALVVTLFRTMIGIETLGTFTPILLSLALRQVTLPIGVLCLGVVILCGWLMRKLLDRLKILVIPRISLILTLVVMIVLVLMVIGYHFGFHQVLYMSLFPMVIMTWMVERFSVLEIEDSTTTAMRTMLGTVIVSCVTYWVFGLKILRSYLFAFPECLFIVMGLLILLGRYTGIRLFEVFRFWDLIKKTHRPRG